jgi:hypothetical protein
MRRLPAAVLVTFLLSLAPPIRADNIDGAVHVSGGSDSNPTTRAAFSAGFHFDPAIFSLLYYKPHVRSQTFEIGLAYDRVQGQNGATADVRLRMPFFRCYGWEFKCGDKRFWLAAVPSVGKRWGDGGLGAYAAAQVQAVFDLSREHTGYRLAVGVQHRFPFNSSLHGDNSVVLELRTFIAFIDRPPRTRPPVPPETKNSGQ